MKKSERKNWYKEEDERLQRLRKEAEEKKLENKDGKTILGVILIFWMFSSLLIWLYFSLLYLDMF